VIVYCVVDLQGLQILKASLESKTVLTDVFLGRVAGGPEPQHELSLRGISPPESLPSVSVCSLIIWFVILGMFCYRVLVYL
jgi:hypothetical protein